MIDRSQFYDELRRNPGLAQRIAIIVNGEVGAGAPTETKMLNAETIFNRAAARGQSLEQVTRQAGQQYSDGKGGYYPATTFTGGQRALNGSQNKVNDFYHKVLNPVLGGSDVSTDKLGFAATGNASNNPNDGERGMVANHGIANGYYTKYKWVGPEVYVQHKPDNVARLESARFNRPPGDVPNVDVANLPAGAKPAAFSQATGGATAPAPAAPAPVGDQPWEPTNAQQQELVAGYPGAPPASPAAPARNGYLRALPPAAPAAAPAGGGLGDAIIKAMGPRGAGMSTYEDPTTKHQIMNPGGSGESAMGLTRDLGLARPFLARSSQARPAPAPQSSAGRPAPPVVQPAVTPAGPVSREPYNISLDEGPTPPSAISSRPSPTSGDVMGGMFDVKPVEQQRPLGDFKPAQPPRAAWSPFETAPPDVLPMPTRPVSIAPPEAAALAPPPPPPPQMTPQQEADAGLAFSLGGTPMRPQYQPATVSQQMTGQSPFAPPQPQFPSATLLPFQQWPPVGWGGGEGFGGFGGGGWAAPASFDFGAFG